VGQAIYLHWYGHPDEDGLESVVAVYGSARRALRELVPDIDPVVLRTLAKALTAGESPCVALDRVFPDQFPDGSTHRLTRRYLK
jgi:hypothetical protein